MHLAPLIRDLAVILMVAATVSLVFQRIRQPVVLGYLVAGLIVGPYMLQRPLVRDVPNIKVWAELGVIFLMFSLGLEFSFRKLARVGLSASVTAAYEIFFMMALGFGAGKYLGWRTIDCIFLAAMVSISSTTIIIKALDELKLKTRRFAERIFGILIVEDLVAILILVALSTFAATHTISGMTLLWSGLKLIFVVGSWFLAGYFVVPRFLRYVGKLGSDEMLTILSVGLCLFLAVLADSQRYSVALGAFIMGSIMAESSESQRIEDLINPLRDLFAAIFFVSVGMLIDPRLIVEHFNSVLLITSVLIVGKIVNLTVGSLITGQTLRTSVQVGFGMAQIGEFSFIIATLGSTLEMTSAFLYPIAVAVSVITAFTTPYMIRVSHKVAVALENTLPLKFKERLIRYAAWMQESRVDQSRKKQFYARALRWFLNGLVVTIVFTVVAQEGTPLIAEAFSSNWANWMVQTAGWALAILGAAPFLWAMFFAFRHFRFDRDYRGVGTLFVSRALMMVWLGALSLEFFTPRLALVATSLLLAVLLLVFHKQLASSYSWFEENFLETFEDSPKSRSSKDVFRHLAPWDAHLVRLKVHPNSDLVGTALASLDLRSKHGLNIVVIKRGLKTIVAPHPTEVIYPKDEILLLGTDEQIDAVRGRVEKPPGLAERFRDLSGYELRKLRLTETSSLVGHSIRSSGIREKHGAMVVGIERDDHRMINPHSDLVLKADDTIWLVGDIQKLQNLH